MDQKMAGRPTPATPAIFTIRSLMCDRASDRIFELGHRLKSSSLVALNNGMVRIPGIGASPLSPLALYSLVVAPRGSSMTAAGWPGHSAHSNAPVLSDRLVRRILILSKGMAIKCSPTAEEAGRRRSPPALDVSALVGQQIVDRAKTFIVVIVDAEADDFSTARQLPLERRVGRSRRPPALAWRCRLVAVGFLRKRRRSPATRDPTRPGCHIFR